jgi:chemotaxis methyl-accepting protein methylase
MSRHWGLEFDRFLQAALPPLGLTPARHRRKAVRRKTAARMDQLRIRRLADYLERIQGDPLEAAYFKRLLGVTISRFFRNWSLFEFLAENVFPDASHQAPPILLSIGCASGEEPYSLAVLWRERGPGGVKPIILGLDMQMTPLRRAQAGVYQAGSLKEAPAEWQDRYFTRRGSDFYLDESIKQMVHFLQGDFWNFALKRDCRLILCRNMAYTYFDRAAREQATVRLAEALEPGGCLAVGAKDKPPGPPLERVHPCLYQKTK